MKYARARNKKSSAGKKGTRDTREVQITESSKTRRTVADPYAPKGYESAQQKRKAADPYMPKKQESVKTRTSSTQTERGVSAIQKRRNAKQKKKLIWARITTAAVVCVCILSVVVFGVGAGMYAAISREIDDLDFEAIAYNFSSIVYASDENGNYVDVEYLHDSGTREWVESDKIPQVAKEAAVAIEDERFYKHKGVDLKRTTGAVFGWFTSKITGKSPSYGGSTITQQLIKNITNEKDKTVTRKVKEMMRATAFEKRYSKEEILSTYLNVVYFGNQCYGIEAASKMYFSKSAIDLTLPEAAMIVGITQAPSRFDPFKNPENAKNKRDTVLAKMYELGKISEEEYNKAVATSLGVNSKRKSLSSSVYSYFVDQVINDVIADLQAEKGYSQSFASSQIFSGGLKIYTTMDSNIQSAMEEVYENTSNFPGASGGVQSAMVIVDPATGEIKGMVGGIGKKTESRGLNRATQSTRQPGSSVKPISVYGPSLEKGKITAATIVTDSPLTVGDWSPKNSYSGFKGDMSIRKAIEISANIPAVKTLQTLGVDESYKFMTEELGFTTLSENDRNLSALGLGGMTRGVSPREMAGAYAVFANKGMYIEPITYTKVLDNSGKVLLEKKPETRRAMSEANAFIMTRFLKEVVNGSAGTGRSAKLASMPTYGKTGTSNDNKDKWFCGFTPYYVGTVWYGYDASRSVGGTNISTQVWKKVMEKVHEGLPEKDFEQPESVTVVSICQKTGKLSSEGCVHGKPEFFARGTIPSKYCANNHSGVVGAVAETPATSTTIVVTREPIATEVPTESEETLEVPVESKEPEKTLSPIATQQAVTPPPPSPEIVRPPAN